MTSPANRDENIVFTREPDTSDYIGSAATARNDGWSPVDHGVGNNAGDIIAQLAGTE
jgi:hypothetical protein